MNNYKETQIENTNWVIRTFSNGQKCYYNNKTQELSWQVPTIEKRQEGKAIDAEPIPESDWYLVKSDKNEIFYFHGPSQTSFWERPDELLMNKHYDVVYKKFKGDIESNFDNVNKRERVGDEIEIKKAKDDEYEKYINEELKNYSNDESSSLETDEEIQNIDENKNEYVTTSIDELADKLHQLPYEEKVSIFKEMLDEYNVSAFNTWEKEVEKMKNDPRLEMLSLKDRKHYFNEYLKERVKSEANMTRKTREEKKEKFFEFLKKYVKDPRMKYLEFSSKYSLLPDFKIFTRTKEREMVFNEFMDKYIRSMISIDPKVINK